jgi:hypothetical protein
MRDFGLSFPVQYTSIRTFLSETRVLSRRRWVNVALEFAAMAILRDPGARAIAATARVH